MIQIGSIVTLSNGDRRAVVESYPAIVPSWSILDRAGIRTSIPESEIVAVEPVAFGVAEKVRLPFGEGVGAVIEDDGAVVTVQIAHRSPLPSGCFHAWIGESFIGRGELVAANKL